MKRYILIFLLLGCGLVSCISIKTGPTSEKAIKNSSNEASRKFKLDWVNRFESFQPGSKPFFLADLMDTVGNNYLNYGFEVVKEWRFANARTAQPISAAQMAYNIEEWTSPQQAMSDVYRECIDYGMQQLKQSGSYEPETLQLFLHHDNLLKRVNQTVFQPTGTVEDYEFELGQIQREFKTSSRELREDLEKYR